MVIFVIAVALCYFSKGKPTDHTHLYNNVVGHWFQTSFSSPFSKEGQAKLPSSYVLSYDRAGVEGGCLF